MHEYFIASNEVMWDYTPSMMDMCGDEPAEFDDDAAGILVPSNLSMVIGHQQLKAIFEEYTDNTFKTKKVGAASLHLLTCCEIRSRSIVGSQLSWRCQSDLLGLECHKYGPQNLHLKAQDMDQTCIWKFGDLKAVVQRDDMQHVIA